MTDPASGQPPTSAADVLPLFSPRRLRLARESRALTQTELARRAGLTPAAISQFEKAQARPTEARLAVLANVLEFPVAFFATGSSPSSRPDDDLDNLDGFGHFRSLRSITATQRRAALTTTHLVRDVVSVLSDAVQLPVLLLPRIPLDPEADAVEAEEIAATVRSIWSLPAGPVADQLRSLERHGIVAARHSIDAATVHAFSAPFPERPVVILGRDGKRDRDRHSAAHELGHLVMHTAGQHLAAKNIEAQAHRFAAAFLMPESDIIDELSPRADWAALQALKQRWGTSMASLLRRSWTLGVMSENTYQQAMKVMGSRGWRLQEPGDAGSAESPSLLTAAATLANVGASDLSAQTGWPAERIVELLDDSTDARPTLIL